LRSLTPAILPLRQNGQLLALIDVLPGPVNLRAAAPKWRFLKLRPHWLYDEVDLASNRHGSFVHRVLISDGRVMEIPFVSVTFHSIPLSPLTGDDRPRASA
jgi:hypothetical protein